MIKYILIFSNLLNCNMAKDLEVVEGLRAALETAENPGQLKKAAMEQLGYFAPVFKYLKEQGLTYEIFGYIFDIRTEMFLYVITSFCGKTIEKETFERLKANSFVNCSMEEYFTLFSKDNPALFVIQIIRGTEIIGYSLTKHESLNSLNESK